MSVSSNLSESEFRALARQLYNHIGAAFDDIDPDRVELEESQGSLTLELADGSKWILSLQPPVRQLWLAVASIGRAFHFNYDAHSHTWQDDKGEGIELLAYLQSLLREQAGVDITL